jgi:hypothetical protein
VTFVSFNIIINWGALMYKVGSTIYKAIKEKCAKRKAQKGAA